MSRMAEILQIDEPLFRVEHKYNRGRLLLGHRNNNGDSRINSSDDSDSSIDQAETN